VKQTRRLQPFKRWREGTTEPSRVFSLMRGLHRCTLSWRSSAGPSAFDWAATNRTEPVLSVGKRVSEAWSARVGSGSVRKIEALGECQGKV